jgi:hypothetical protein
VADLRLLSAVFLLLGAGAGCAIGPVYARRLEGRVVDRETGQGVAGTEIFSWYEAHPLLGWLEGPEPRRFDHRWATTDESGRFAIPGHLAITFYAWPSYTKRHPSFKVVHPQYGWIFKGYDKHDRFPGWREVEFSIQPDPVTLSLLMNDPERGWPSFCSVLGREGCRRACEVLLGSVQACIDVGAPLWD